MVSHCLRDCLPEGRRGLTTIPRRANRIARSLIRQLHGRARVECPKLAKAGTMKTHLLMLSGLIVLAACEGPQEQAGEKQDEAAANAAGIPYRGSGPAERMGEAKDRAAAAAREAREAAADALEA